mgnify:CR=1 FL=1
MALIFRPAVYEDIGFFFYLSQCPEIRALSGNPTNPSWPEHLAWWDQQLPRSLFYVAEQENGHPVGVIRFEPDRASQDLHRSSTVERLFQAWMPDDEKQSHYLWVSVAIATRFQGNGYGTWLIQQTSRLAAFEYRQPIIAEIYQDNRASIAAFQKAGYFWCGVENGLHRFQYANR